MDPQLFAANAVMLAVSPSGIHDLDRPEWMSLPFGNPSECNAVVVAALLFGDL
jgi:hypothetical protein